MNGKQLKYGKCKTVYYLSCNWVYIQRERQLQQYIVIPYIAIKVLNKKYPEKTVV